MQHKRNVGLKIEMHQNAGKWRWILVIGAPLLFTILFVPRVQAATNTLSTATLAYQSPLFGGVPEGPVGTYVVVSGTGWTPGATVTFGIIPSNAQCSASSLVDVTTLAPTTVPNSGTVTATFIWPSNVAQQGAYTTCGTESNGGSQVASTPSPFYLLSNGSGTSAAPSVSINVTTANTGDTLSVNGANWLPSQSVELRIQDANSSIQVDPGESLTKINSDQSGNFQAKVTLPIDRVNQRVILAVAGTPFSGMYPLMARSQPFTVNLAPTPTPQPTATVIPTAVPTVGKISNTPAPSISTQQLLVVLLGVIAIVLLIAGVIVAVLALRGPKNPRPPDDWQQRSGPPRSPWGDATQQSTQWDDPGGPQGGQNGNGWNNWSEPAGRPWSGRESRPYHGPLPPEKTTSFDEDLYDDPYRTRMGDPYQTPPGPPMSRPVNVPPMPPPGGMRQSRPGMWNDQETAQQDPPPDNGLPRR